MKNVIIALICVMAMVACKKNAEEITIIDPAHPEIKFDKDGTARVSSTKGITLTGLTLDSVYYYTQSFGGVRYYPSYDVIKFTANDTISEGIVDTSGTIRYIQKSHVNYVFKYAGPDGYYTIIYQDTSIHNPKGAFFQKVTTMGTHIRRLSDTTFGINGNISVLLKH